MMSGNKINRRKDWLRGTLLFLIPLLFIGCQSPDELLPSVARSGINSITASFEDGTGEFVGVPNENKEIEIEIPFYYPIESQNEVTAEMLSKMRVRANLDDNVTVTPKLLYLDLTKENTIQIVDQRKQKHDFIVRAVIAKNNLCEIEEFELPESGLTGVINDKNKTISLVSFEDIPAQLAKIRISPHATIEPDPTKVKLDYNQEVELKVTAHNGVNSQTYKVIKNVPPKLDYGIRKGSTKLLFAKQLKQDLGIGVDNLTGGIALSGENLVINTRGENSIYIDAKTGAKKGEVNLGAVKGSLINFYNTSDAAGNILISNLSPGAGSFKIWTLKSVADTPKLLIDWNTDLALGRKISIAGSLDGNAIITAPTYTGTTQKFARWIVTNGQLKSNEPELITMSGLARGWTTNADIVYTSADVTSDYFVASYSDNTFAWVDGRTNKVKASLDEIDRNYIQSAVDFIEFNKAKFTAVNHVNSFNWGQADQVWLLDVTEQGLFSGSLTAKTAKAVVWECEKDKYGAKAIQPIIPNGNGTGDVLLSVSEDGYFLYVYFLFTNGYVVGYQFDCMDV